MIIKQQATAPFSTKVVVYRSAQEWSFEKDGLTEWCVGADGSLLLTFPNSQQILLAAGTWTTVEFTPA